MTGIDFSLLNQPFVILENNNILWTFAANSEKQLVCRYSLDGGKIWTEDFPLIINFSGEFNLAFDQDYNIHLAGTDDKGRLFYFTWQEEQWKKRNISTSGLVQTVFITTYNNHVDLIYLTFTDTENHMWHLKHSRLVGNEKSPEKVVASGLGYYLNKGVACYDSEATLHVVYRIYDNNCYQLFHSSLSYFDNDWPTPKPIGYHIDNSTPCLLADDYGDLHLVYTISDGVNLRTAYLRKRRQPGWLMPEWHPVFYLSPEGHNAYTPTLVIKERQIFALWQQVDGIYRRLSINSGLEWGKIYKDYNFENIVQLTPYKVNQARKENIKISSFGPTTSELSLIAASHFNQEEYFSPTPMETGNHFIFPLQDKIAYVPKGMQLFASLMNNQLHRLINIINGYRNYIEGLNKISSLPDERRDETSIEELHNKINSLQQELKLKELKIHELTKSKIETTSPPTEEKAPASTKPAIRLLPKVNRNKTACKVSIKYK